jgi:hypothetical protein
MNFPTGPAFLKMPISVTNSTIKTVTLLLASYLTRQMGCSLTPLIPRRLYEELF